jgi:hypothetical protein
VHPAPAGSSKLCSVFLRSISLSPARSPQSIYSKLGFHYDKMTSIRVHLPGFHSDTSPLCASSSVRESAATLTVLHYDTWQGVSGQWDTVPIQFIFRVYHLIPIIAKMINTKTLSGFSSKPYQVPKTRRRSEVRCEMQRNRITSRLSVWILVSM